MTYEPYGSVKTVALGNGLSVANDRGNDGRLASRRLYQTSGGTNLSWLASRYDANDNIGVILDKSAIRTASIAAMTATTG